jgi:hypothetical protein
MRRNRKAVVRRKMTASTLECVMVTPETLDDWKLAGRDGDVFAGNIYRAVTGSLHTIRQNVKPPLECVCLDCDEMFSARDMPEAFAVIVPMFPEFGDEMMACAICGICLLRSDLEDAVQIAVRETCPSAHFGQRRLQ